jgi:HPt (histidine-containing phosphotransfer) domain-containing protein
MVKMSKLPACDYSEAVQRVGGDLALLSQVLVIFLDEMPKMKAAIRKYAEEGNSRLLWNESHKMKGAAGHFGGAQLVHVLEQIEGFAKNNDFPSVIGLLSTLTQTAERFKSCVSQWQNSPGNSVIV